MAKTKAVAKKSSAKTIDSFDGKTIAVESDTTIVHAFKLGRDCGVIAVVEYKGKKSLDIRRFYLGDDDAWHHTSKGIRVPAEGSAALAFLQALEQKQEIILGLLN